MVSQSSIDKETGKNRNGDTLASVFLVGPNITFKVGAGVPDPTSTTGKSKRIVSIAKPTGASYRIEYDDGTYDLMTQCPVIARWEKDVVVRCSSCNKPIGPADQRETDGQVYCIDCNRVVLRDLRQSDSGQPSIDEDASQDVTEEEIKAFDVSDGEGDAQNAASPANNR